MTTRVIILAAGKGTRMGADIPKPLVEVAGRPMIEHLLDNVRDSEIGDRPIVVVSPDSVSQFNEVCRDKDCEYVVQEDQLGTGHAVQVAEDACNGADTIIVLYGDHPFISAETIDNLIEMHEASHPAITMLTTKVPNFKKEYSIFKSWSRIVRDDVGRITRDVQVKDATEEELEIKEVNPCIFAFNAEWLWGHLPEVKNQNAQNEYYLTDLIALAIEEGAEVITSPAKPFEVIGVNSQEELQRAEEYFA